MLVVVAGIEVVVIEVVGVEVVGVVTALVPGGVLFVTGLVLTVAVVVPGVVLGVADLAQPEMVKANISTISVCINSLPRLNTFASPSFFMRLGYRQFSISHSKNRVYQTPIL